MRKLALRCLPLVLALTSACGDEASIVAGSEPTDAATTNDTTTVDAATVDAASGDTAQADTAAADTAATDSEAGDSVQTEDAVDAVDVASDDSGSDTQADAAETSSGDAAQTDGGDPSSDAAGDAASTDGSAVDAAAEDAGADSVGDVEADGSIIDATVTDAGQESDTAADSGTADDAAGDTGGGQDAVPPPPECTAAADCTVAKGAAAGCQQWLCQQNACVQGAQADSTACNDGNACTKGDSCQQGQCVGQAVTCDDQNPCTNDACDPQNGACVTSAANAACDDGNACTVDDACKDGSCSGGSAKTCDDGNPCTDDACDPKSGCTTSPNAAPCKVADACLTAGTCANGACQPGPAIDCDDNNPCTTDSCAGGACKLVATAGFCDDGNPCTEADACASGKCASGQQKACSDGNPCTADSCDPGTGACVFVPAEGPCDGGNLCLGPASCKAGACEPGAPIDCDDKNPCTDDSCAPSKGCQHTANTATCDDATKCVLGTCADSVCKVGNAKGCNDNNPCTTDTCDDAKGCIYTAVADKTACGSEDGCTNAPLCMSGQCLAAVPKNCADTNPCTDDTCDPKSGCLWLPNKAACDDGNACTKGDLCSNGKCLSGNAIDPKADCDDGNACTSDACDPKSGCTHTGISGPCDDGNICTSGEACAAGACGGGKESLCDDGTPCTVDKCDPKTGACTWIQSDGPCSDGEICTVGDTCANGACQPGKLTACNDNEPCTTDACDGKGGCVNTLLAGATTPACDGTSAAGSCWKAFAGNVNRQQAEDACVKWGGHLARVDSAEQNTAVRNLASGTCGGGSTPWIGLGDAAAEGKYVWADGTPLSGYSNWSGGEPNNSLLQCGQPDAGEDGVQMLTNGAWNDVCTLWTTACYVCRRPLPSTVCADPAKCLTGGLCVAGKCTALKQSCDDGNPCTTDSCDVAKGCLNVAAADGTACGTGFSCSKGVCSVGSPSNPAKSCVEVRDAGGKDGVFTIDPDGAAGAEPAFQVWCDNTNDGGGWTLVLKADGNKQTFVYGAAIWGTKAALAPAALAIDLNETKLASYWTLPLKEVRVGMRTGNTTLWAKVAYSAASLHAVLADGVYKAWSPPLGRNAWKALVPGGSLQPNCNREGFNNAIATNGPATVRIGIIANNEADCSTPDSRIGIGMGGNYCGIDAGIAVGNGAGCGGDTGDKNIKSFGYVFVR